MYEDRKIVCIECGTEFVFEAAEQEFYAQKGFVDAPKRCKSCIKARKAQRNVKHTVICFECGCECQVPFEPKGDKPVYCSKCFVKKK